MKSNKPFTQSEVKITSIWKADDRERDLGDINELAKDIKRVGLLQPIVISQDAQLLAGERRLTACSKLGWEKIPVVIAPPSVGPDDMVIIELLENTSRKGFEWHEEIQLKLKLHNIWVAEAKAQKEAWNYKLTAKRFGYSVGSLSTDLEMAKAIGVFPQLKACATKGKAREAYKKIAKQAEAIQAMADIPKDQQEKVKEMLKGNFKTTTKESVESSSPSIPTAVYDDSEITLPRNECSNVEQPITEPGTLPEHTYAITQYSDFIPCIPDNSVGFIELDPPYAIDFNTVYGQKDNIQSHAVDWTVDTLVDFYNTYMPILFDKLLDDSFMLCWTGKEHVAFTQELALSAGFKIQPPGVWVKPGGSTNSPRTTMTSCYETFLVLRKGDATFNVPSMRNVIEFNSVPSAHKIHQWEKPFELCKYLVKVFGRPNTIFLSPFAGSGNTLIAAALADMIPMGCDTSDKYIHLFYENFKNYYL